MKKSIVGILGAVAALVDIGECRVGTLHVGQLVHVVLREHRRRADRSEHQARNQLSGLHHLSSLIGPGLRIVVALSGGHMRRVQDRVCRVN